MVDLRALLRNELRAWARAGSRVRGVVEPLSSARAGFSSKNRALLELFSEARAFAEAYLSVINNSPSESFFPKNNIGGSVQTILEYLLLRFIKTLL